MRPNFSSMALIAGLLVLTGAPAALADDKRTVTVSGLGTASAPPDMAIVTAGVVTQAATAGEAMTANAAATTAVIARIKGDGVEAKDLQTGGFGLQPVYVYPKTDDGSTGTPRITGYSVNNVVTARIRDLGKLGSILDKVVGAGANTINGVTFLVSNESALADRARGDAVADARRKAELYAAAAGARLGKVLTLAEASSAAPAPYPMRAKATFEAAPTPIEAGENELRVELNVTFELD
jgi:uncharacterized protein